MVSQACRSQEGGGSWISIRVLCILGSLPHPWLEKSRHREGCSLLLWLAVGQGRERQEDETRDEGLREGGARRNKLWRVFRNHEDRMGQRLMSRLRQDNNKDQDSPSVWSLQA